MAKNGEFPPQPKDEKERAFLQSRGVVFLEGEFEYKVLEMFFNALESKEFGVGLNYAYCKSYCKKFKFDIVEIYSLLNKLLNVVNKHLKRNRDV